MFLDQNPIPSLLQLKQHEFREKFRHDAPFSFSDPDPYKSLNKVLVHCGEVPMAALGTLLERWSFLKPFYCHKWKHGLNGTACKTKHVHAWDSFVWTYMWTCRLRHPPRSHTASTLPHCSESYSKATTTHGHMSLLQASWADLSTQAGFIVPMKSFLSPGLNSCPFLSPIHQPPGFTCTPHSVLTAQVLASG